MILPSRCRAGHRSAAIPWSPVSMAVGFALGIGLRSEEWGQRLLLTKHRPVLTRDSSIHPLPKRAGRDRVSTSNVDLGGRGQRRRDRVAHAMSFGMDRQREGPVEESEKPGGQLQFAVSPAIAVLGGMATALA